MMADISIANTISKVDEAAGILAIMQHLPPSGNDGPESWHTKKAELLWLSEAFRPFYAAVCLQATSDFQADGRVDVDKDGKCMVCFQEIIKEFPGPAVTSNPLLTKLNKFRLLQVRVLSVSVADCKDGLSTAQT